MACRGLKKAEAARADILRQYPCIAPEKLTLMGLDLADLDSVAQGAKHLLEKGQVLDGLLNNAGVMALPQQKTAQGFEMQSGTNHLGRLL